MASWSIVLGCAVLLVAGVDVDAPAQSESREPSAVISGKITIEGAPVAGVPVLLLKSIDSPGAAPVGRVSTDADGNYRLSGIAAGEYSVNAFAPAYYYPTSEYYGPRGRAVTLREAEIADGVDFKLVRGGVITGKVTDSSGKPVVEEYIRLAMLDENGREVPVPYSDGFRTDDRGVYRVYGLEPGSYLISAGEATGQFSMGAPRRFYQLTYHPGVTERRSAAIVEIAPGGEAPGVDIALGKMNASYAVNGRVIDADTGKGVAGIMMGYDIRLSDNNGAAWRQGHPDWLSGPQGDFRLEGVPPGHYSAFGVPANDSDFYSDLAYFDVTEGDVERIEVKLHRGATISGIVTLDPASDPALNARLLQLRLGAIATPNNGNLRSSAPISPDGSFRITGVTAGKTRIALVRSEPVTGFYISSIQREGVEQSGVIIDVAAADQMTGLRVTVSYGTGTIRGQVKYAGGAPPATLESEVVARLGADPRAKYATVDSRGIFVIEGLREGEYDVTLQIYSSRSPGREVPSVHQKVTVALGASTEALFVVDLSKQQ